MEIRNQVHGKMPYHSKRYDDHFGGLRVLFLDIETTGLYPATSKVILGGLLATADSTFHVRQYFLENHDDEKDLLSLYCGELSEADVLITYNGNSFDIPFLKQRLAVHGLPIEIDHCQTFDLYRALHYYSKLRDILPNLKQKTIETYLGLSTDRKDEISGQESVLLYQEYREDGSLEKRDKILLHNHDDLIQLATILKVVDKLDLDRILFHEGFTVAVKEMRIFINTCSIKNKMLTVSGFTKNLPADYYSFAIGYQAIHRSETRTFTLEVPLQEENGISYLDLETIPMDFSKLMALPAYRHGYFVLKQREEIEYGGTIHLVKRILGEILSGF